MVSEEINELRRQSLAYDSPWNSPRPDMTQWLNNSSKQVQKNGFKTKNSSEIPYRLLHHWWQYKKSLELSVVWEHFDLSLQWIKYSNQEKVFKNFLASLLLLNVSLIPHWIGSG